MNKKNSFSLLSGIALLFSMSIAQAESPLEGAWLAVSNVAEDGTETDAQSGLYVFTPTHYSIMFVNTAEARPAYEGEQQTDAEKLANYNSITANSGRYEIDGNILKTRAYVAKDTNYMGGWPDNETTFEFSVDGDKLTIKSISFPAAFTVIMRQVEGTENPWDSD